MDYFKLLGLETQQIQFQSISCEYPEECSYIIAFT